MSYQEWIRGEAAKVNSDGCTVVTELFRSCCLEHDLAYHYKKDPLLAYFYGWVKAPSITRAEADRRFRRCMQRESMLGRWSPVAAYRWLGVRIGGYFKW